MSSKTQENSTCLKCKWTKDRTPTKDEHISWKSRIQKANASKWTPELKRAFQRQARNFQLAELRKKKCKRMFKSNAVARNAWATGMSMWTPTSVNFRSAPVKERETRTAECLGTMHKLQRMVDIDADDEVDGDDYESLSRSIRRSAADAELDKMEEEILTNGGAEAESEMEKLMKELEKSLLTTRVEQQNQVVRDIPRDNSRISKGSLQILG